MHRDRRSHDRIVVYRAEVPGEDDPHEVQYESIADALHFACRDLRSGRRRPLEITEDGKTVMDGQRIRRACEEEQADIDAWLDGGQAAAGE